MTSCHKEQTVLTSEILVAVVHPSHNNMTADVTFEWEISWKDEQLTEFCSVVTAPSHLPESGAGSGRWGGGLGWRAHCPMDLICFYCCCYLY